MGYGHVGRAVAQLAGWLGFRVVAADDRPTAGGAPEGPDPGVPGGDPPEGPDPGVPGGDAGDGAPDELVIGSVDDLLEGRILDQDTSVVLVTRNVDGDSAALPALLATGAGYVGVMGSERRWATIRLPSAE